MTTPSPISGDNEAEMKPWSVVVSIDRSTTMTLRLRGAINADAAPTLDRTLVRLRHGDRHRRAPTVTSEPLTIDCSAITFMDVRGLGCRLGHGRYLRLVNPSRHLQRLVDSL
jgi:STAS domain